MPRVFKIGSYIIYFWVNENDPLEPVHVHVCEAMQCYHAKYGVYAVVDNYVIYFEPFAVIHMISSAD